MLLDLLTVGLTMLTTLVIAGLWELARTTEQLNVEINRLYARMEELENKAPRLVRFNDKETK
jgi:hypothetical protein